MEGETVVAHVLYADGFGNLILDAIAADLQVGLGGPLRIDGPAGNFDAVRTAVFAEAGEDGIAVYESAGGRLAVAVNGGDAARRLGVSADGELRLAPA